MLEREIEKRKSMPLEGPREDYFLVVVVEKGESGTPNLLFSLLDMVGDTVLS